MQGTPAELADFARRLQGNAPQPQSGNQMSRTVTDPNTLASVIAPIIGSMLGAQNAQRVPHLAGGLTPHDALYAINVANRQWELTTQRAVYEFSRAVGSATAEISNNLGLSRAIGMSARAMQEKAASLASSPGGLFAAQTLMSNPMMQTLMGGNPLGVHQTMFANRHLFTPFGNVGVHPYDPKGQEVLRQTAEDFSSKLVRAAYADGRGGMGITPNYNFTRGFAVQDIGNVAASAMEHGRRLDGNMQQVGQLTRSLEALGNVIGSTDMNELMGALNRLTNNRWAHMDWNVLHRNLVDMSSTAQLLNVNSREMFNTVTTIQDAMHGAIGVTPTQQAFGRTGGAFTGPHAALDMATRIYSIAEATGRRSPDDIARITAQQTALMAMGMDSRAGRVSRLIEYMAQENLGDPGKYAAYRSTLDRGSPAQRYTAAMRFLSDFPGGSDAMMAAAMDDTVQRDIAERTGVAAERRIRSDITRIQRNEFGQRMTTTMARDIARQSEHLRALGGVPRIMDPGAAADAESMAVYSYLGKLGTRAVDAANNPLPNEYDYGATVLKQVAAATEAQMIASGADPRIARAEGWNKALMRLRTDPTLSETWQVVREKIAGARALSASDYLIADSDETRSAIREGAVNKAIIATLPRTAANDAAIGALVAANRDDPVALSRTIMDRVRTIEGVTPEVMRLAGVNAERAREAVTMQQSNLKVQRYAHDITQMASDAGMDQTQAMGNVARMSGLLGFMMQQPDAGAYRDSALEILDGSYGKAFPAYAIKSLRSAIESGDPKQLGNARDFMQSVLERMNMGRVSTQKEYNLLDIGAGISDANAGAFRFGMTKDQVDKLSRHKAITNDAQAYLRMSDMQAGALLLMGDTDIKSFLRLQSDASPDDVESAKKKLTEKAASGLIGRSRSLSLKDQKKLNESLETIRAIEEETGGGKQLTRDQRKRLEKSREAIAFIAQHEEERERSSGGSGGEMKIKGTLQLVDGSGRSRTVYMNGSRE